MTVTVIFTIIALCIISFADFLAYKNVKREIAKIQSGITKDYETLNKAIFVKGYRISELRDSISTVSSKLERVVRTSGIVQFKPIGANHICQHEEIQSVLTTEYLTKLKQELANAVKEMKEICENSDNALYETMANHKVMLNKLAEFLNVEFIPAQKEYKDAFYRVREGLKEKKDGVDLSLSNDELLKVHEILFKIWGSRAQISTKKPKEAKIS